MIIRRGGFRIYSRGWQEISTGSSENLPGGGEKIVCYPPSPQRFCIPTQHFSFTPTFLTCKTLVIKKYIKYTYFFFLVRLLSFIRKFSSPQVQEGLKPLEMVRGWRGGPRHPPEIASGYPSHAFCLSLYYNVHM